MREFKHRLLAALDDPAISAKIEAKCRKRLSLRAEPPSLPTLDPPAVAELCDEVNKQVVAGLSVTLAAGRLL